MLAPSRTQANHPSSPSSSIPRKEHYNWSRAIVALRAELEGGSLVSLPLGQRKLRRRWGVAHLKGRRLALAEETFVGLCLSVSEALGLKAPGVAA